MLEHAQAAKFPSQSLSRHLKFCYCACWDRPPSWLSCMIQCLRLSGIHSLDIPLPKSPEVWSGKLHSTPNISWQHEGHTKAQEPQLFLFQRSDHFRFLFFLELLSLLKSLPMREAVLVQWWSLIHTVISVQFRGFFVYFGIKEMNSLIQSYQSKRINWKIFSSPSCKWHFCMTQVTC